MNIAIRADASPAIGTGHIVRCMTLAGALRAQGANVRFICRRLPTGLHSRIAEAGFDLALLAGEAKIDEAKDAAAVQAVLADLVVDWLVVDHYELGIAWEQSLRGVAGRLMVIDDLARTHDCDLLLDQNYYLKSDDRYDGLTPPAATRLTGPGFAMLRPEFAERAARLRPRDGAVRRLNLFMGGVDQGNAVSAALDALERVDLGGAEVDVVIGSAHPYRTEIEARCNSVAGYTCHVDTPHMAALLAEADFAIGAGGTATWERCALGVPTLALCLADNQREVLSNASRAGLLYAPDIDARDTEALAACLKAVLCSDGLRNHLSTASMALVDGRGVYRVASAIIPMSVDMRPATQADCEDLYEWRNHPSVRSVSRNRDEISLADHRRWFARVLQDANRKVLIGERDGSPVGVVRLDREGDEVEVSIYLVPLRAGRGEGSALLLSAENQLRSLWPEVRNMRAEVLDGNAASLRLFERCGYEKHALKFFKRLAS